MNHQSAQLTPTNNVNTVHIVVGIIIAIFLLRLSTLGAYPLFDPTESRYAEMGRKMLETGNWITPQIDYNVPFWAKPPLSFWLTALSYKIFGINEFAARFPSFMLMAGVAALTYVLALRAYGHASALLALAVLASLPLFFYMAGGVMTDPALAFSTTLSMVAFWRALTAPNRLWGYMFFIGLTLSLLAKGPIGLVLTGLPVGGWVLWNNKWKLIWEKLPWVSGTIVMLSLSLPWYVMAEKATPGFLRYFIIGEHYERFLVKGWKGDLYGTGRAKPVGTIWFYGLIATLPFSLLLLLGSLTKNFRQALFSKIALQDEWLHYLWLWVLMPLLFFTFSRNIIISYVITMLPAFALLTVYLLKQVKQENSFLTLGLFAVSPLLFIAFLITVHSPFASSIAKSQKEIVTAYHHTQAADTRPLNYFLDKPYSADFYSGGKAVLLKSFEEAGNLIYREGNNFLAISPNRYTELPEVLKKRLTVVTQYHNTLLVRTHSPKGS
jgi:4-amino-4-deoxy-L-arabinose transferase-like glycosyltransferase